MAFLIIGIILIGVGVILFFVQKNEKAKSQSIKLARTATVSELRQLAKDIAQEMGGGHWRDYVKISGVIECDRPLTSQLKQEPCVHYKMSVKREFEETVTRRDTEDKTYQETNRGSETVSSNQESTPFLLRDQTGAIEVDPEKAEIETVKVLDEFQQERPAGGMVAMGGFTLTLGNDPQRPGRRTLGYHYSESILPVQRRAFVIGMVCDEAEGLIIRKPIDAHQKFIISLKSEEQLLSSTETSAKNLSIGMVVCLAIGVVLVVVGLLA